MINVKDLTLEEKLNLLVLGTMFSTYNAGGKIPEVLLSDGPNGVRRACINNNQAIVHCYPALHVLANTGEVDTYVCRKSRKTRRCSASR